MKYSTARLGLQIVRGHVFDRVAFLWLDVRRNRSPKFIPAGTFAAQSGAAVPGGVTGGEAEDCIWTCTPTAVTLHELGAAGSPIAGMALLAVSGVFGTFCFSGDAGR